MASASLAGMRALPDDALISIFSFLPVPDLARCASVCGQWQRIVTDYTHLWKDKGYVNNRRPSDSDETRAVLRTIPPLQEVIIERAPQFAVDICYPNLILMVHKMRDLKGCPILTCEFLSTRLDILGDILSSRSAIDFRALQKLQVLRIPALNVWHPPIYRADYVVGAALEACPNLRELCVYAESLSVDYLDTLHGIGQLRALEIVCPKLDRLGFLRYCSDALEELYLCCSELPSAEVAELRRLGKLRKLGLSECRVTQWDLAAAAAALQSLASLRLDRCDLVHDLGLLRGCRALRELSLVLPPAPGAPLTLRDARLRRHRRHMPRLPADPGVHSFPLRSLDLDVVGLARALPLLEDLGLHAGRLHQLSSLTRCAQLADLFLEFQVGPVELDPTTVRVHIKLTTST